jgi:transposase
MWWDDGYPTGEIARMAGVSKPTVLKWVDRFQAEGESGLEDRPKPGRGRWAPVEVRGRIALLTRQGPAEGTGLSHWSSREMARHLKTEGYSVSHSFVVQVWRDLGLKPHRQGTHKVPRDPQFEAKATALCGLYLDPPENAVVLSLDEKTQIQALDRTAPLLPISFGCAEQRTADYVRHGTTNLFAAFNTATGEVTGECQPRRTNVEFLGFMDKIVGQYGDQTLHVIMDNLSTHSGNNVDAWLEKHPQVTFHYTPVGCSWMNQVETWFNIITKQSIRRGTFVSVPHLIKTIKDFISGWNQRCHPFEWTATADDIITQVNMLQRQLDSILANNGRKATSITRH